MATEQSVATEKENAPCVPRTGIWQKWKERSRLSFALNVSKLLHLPIPNSPTESPHRSPTALCRPSTNSLSVLGVAGSQKLTRGPLGDECGVHSQTTSPTGAQVQGPIPTECTTSTEGSRHQPRSRQKTMEAFRDRGVGSAPPVTSALYSMIRPHRPVA